MLQARGIPLKIVQNVKMLYTNFKWPMQSVSRKNIQAIPGSPWGETTVFAVTLTLYYKVRCISKGSREEKEKRDPVELTNSLEDIDYAVDASLSTELQLFRGC